jgi:hypothetical protein
VRIFKGLPTPKAKFLSLSQDIIGYCGQSDRTWNWTLFSHPPYQATAPFLFLNFRSLCVLLPEPVVWLIVLPRRVLACRVMYESLYTDRHQGEAGTGES